MSKEQDWNAAIELMHGAYASKTVSGYRRAVARYVAWCARADETPFPAQVNGMAKFVHEELERVRYRTVKDELSAVRLVHGLLGLACDIDHPDIVLAFRRAIRAERHQQRQAFGLNAELRDRLLAVCARDLRGLRDRALISVGYDTLCRSSELCALDIEDIERCRDGTAKITIKRSKTDQVGAGWYAYLSRRGVKHLDAWLNAAGIQEGALLRRTYSRSIGHAHLAPRAVSRALKYRAHLAGVDERTIEGLSGHSLRVGAAQDLASAGKSILQIMRAGRWAHVEAIEHYVLKAEVNVWDDG